MSKKSKKDKHVCECGSCGSTDAVDKGKLYYWCEYKESAYRKSTYSPAEIADHINSLHDNDSAQRNAIDFLLDRAKSDKTLAIIGICAIAAMIIVLAVSGFRTT